MTAAGPPGGRSPAGILPRGPNLLYIALALLATLAVALGVSLLASALIDNWARRDIEMQTDVAFRSISDQLATAVVTRGGANLGPILDRVAGDNRILALAVCAPDGGLRYATADMPKGFSCAGLPLHKGGSVDRRIAGARLTLSVFPLGAEGKAGSLIVAPNPDYVGRRIDELRFYAFLDLIGVALGFGLMTFTVIHVLRRSWLNSLRSAIADGRRAATPPDLERLDLPVNEEINALLAELRTERKFTDGIHIKWSPENLQLLLQEELPGAQVLIVSNREPYIHNRVDGEIRLQFPPAASWRRWSLSCAPAAARGSRMAAARRTPKPATPTTG